MSRVRDLASILTASSSMATDTEVSAVSAQIPVNVSGKNAAINGAFDIWQRGTTFAGNGAFAASYTADRWQVYRGGGSGISTATRIASDLPGFRYFIRVQRPAGDTTTTYLGLWQSLETANSYAYAGKTVTLSFYARAGSGMTNSFGLGVALYSGTGIDEPWYTHTGSTTVASSNFVLTTTGGIVNGWQRFSVTGNVPSNSNELGITFSYTPTASTASSTDYYEVTGVQLEIGSVATPFSRAGGTLPGELAACQRYYWRTSTGGTYKGFGFGMGFSTTQARCMIQFPQTMRTTPAGVEYGGAIAVMDSVTGYLSTGMSIDGNVMTPQSAYVNVSVASGLTQYRPYFLYSMADANAYVGFSAEL